MKPITEHTLVAKLIKTLREALPEAVIIKHNDQLTAGIPDISITWNGKTSWWEIKFARPAVIGTGLQNLTARRLAAQGTCWYVVYHASCNTNQTPTTNIVQPSMLGKYSYQSHAQCGGYDHQFVLEFVKGQHHG